MTQVWTPNDGTTQCIEWFPVIQGEVLLNSLQKAAAISFRSTVTETINEIDFALGAEIRGAGAWLLEIFEAGNEVPGPISTQTFRPNGDNANPGNNWLDDTPDSTNIYAHIDETVLDTTDYIQYVGTYRGRSAVRFNFNTAAWGADRRVVGGRINVVASRVEKSGRFSVSYHSASGYNYGLGVVVVDQEVREFSIPFPENNPETSAPWTQYEIADLDANASIRIRPEGIGKHKPVRIYQLYMELDYCDENRVKATGSDERATAIFNNGTGMVAAALLFTGLGWAKLADTDYTLMMRRIVRTKPLGGTDQIEGRMVNSGSLAWRYLSEDSVVADQLGRDAHLPDPNMHSYAPILNADGTVAEMGEPGIRGYNFSMQNYTTGGTGSVDGQPYDTLYPLEITIDQGQTFSVSSPGSFEVLRFMVGINDIEADPLTVNVRRRSDDALMASETITAAAALELPVVMSGNETGEPARLLEVQLTPAATLAAVDYYVEWEANDTDALNWTLWIMLAGNYQADVATYGGATQTLCTTTPVAHELVEFQEADVPLTVSTRPDPPTNLSVELALQDLWDPEPACGLPSCALAQLAYARVTWDASALGSDFLRYEIYRATELTMASFKRVFSISTEGVEVAEDYETKRNVDVYYVIRAVRAGDAIGSNIAGGQIFGPITIPLERSALCFTSNENPALNLAFVDHGGGRTYEFLGGDERKSFVLEGQDYQVMAAPINVRGDSFEAELAVWGQSDPVAADRVMFDPLVALARADLSYVCVTNETGRRWFADLWVSQGTRTSKVHTAKIAVTELTDTPTPVDVVP